MLSKTELWEKVTNIPAGSGSSTELAIQKEIGEQLEKAHSDMGKVSKASTKIIRLAEAVQTKSRMLSTALELTVAALETCEGLAADIAFMVKFRKRRDNSEVSLAEAQEVHRQAAEAVLQLVESTKALTALIPTKAD